MEIYNAPIPNPKPDDYAVYGVDPQVVNMVIDGESRIVEYHGWKMVKQMEFTYDQEQPDGTTVKATGLKEDPNAKIIYDARTQARMDNLATQQMVSNLLQVMATPVDPSMLGGMPSDNL